MYYVYLLLLSDNSIYTGITTDVSRRLAEHKSGEGAKYTRGRSVRKLLYSETAADRSAASKREAEIKSWKREKKLELTRGKHS